MDQKHSRSELLDAWDRLDELLVKAGDAIVLDARGHAVRLDAFTRLDLLSEAGARRAQSASPQDPCPLVEAMERGEAVSGEDVLRCQFGREGCFYCGESPEFRFDGQRLWTETPCALGADPQPFEAFLNVPSGKLVMANALTWDRFRVYGELDSVGTLVGRHRLTRLYERVGCLHVTVPSSYSLLVYPRKSGDPHRNLVVFQSHDRDIDQPIFFERTHLAVLGIDPRCYSLVDADEYVRRGGSLADEDICIIPVEPGVYRLTHRAYRPDWDAQPEPEVRSLVDWVRPPDPVRDYQAEEGAFHLTAGQVLWRALQKRKAPGPVSDEVFWGLVSDLFRDFRNWHPNGFAQLSPYSQMDDPSVEIPPLTQRFSWYDARRSHAFHGYSGKPTDTWFSNSLLIQAAIGRVPLNPSFRSLVRTVLRGMVEYGIEVDPFVPSRNDPPKTPQQLADEAAEERRLVGIARQALDAMDLFEPEPALR